MSRPLRFALGIFLLVFAIYNFPLAYDLLHKPFFNWLAGNDVAPATLLPISILQRGDFTLNQFQEFFSQFYIEQYFVADLSGKLVSRYPVAAAILALPFYGVPMGTGWLFQPGYAWFSYPASASFPAKFAAATLAALAMLMFYFCARELTNWKTSTVLAIIFAFGTSVWSTASQALWQQTPSVLFETIGLWFILRGERAGAAALAPGAFFFSAATVARANDAIPAVLFTVYLLLYHRSALVPWILWSIPPAIFFFAYNAIYNGSPFVFGYQDGPAQYLHAPQMDAILGLFLSPSRGLLIYSPFFIFAPMGYWFARREPLSRFYSFCLLILSFGVLLLAMWQYWDGGWGYGTRMLTDLLPYLTLMLIPVLNHLNFTARVAFAAMVVFAMVLNAFSLWDYGWRWHLHWENYRYDVWNWRENEPLFYLKEYSMMARHYLTAFLR